MGEPSIDTLHDVYEDQLSAARYKAERDAAVQELQGLRERNRKLWMDCGMEHELTRCAEDKAERLGKLVWRLQNRLARSHRREKQLRKGMRMWREKAIGGPVHTVSAYDLLPEEDLQTLRWVREQGGLDALKAYTDCFSNLLRECHGYRDLVLDYEKRLMPEGMRWPRYEDGEPVQTGSDAADVEGNALDEPVVSIEFFENGFTLHSDASQAFYGYEERVKRPAVLAADGEPLEVGQTVWGVKDGKEFVVVRPLCGDGLAFLKYRTESGGYVYTAEEPEHLTHTKPEQDSWDSVWMDVSNGGETPQGMKRRCKAIAERGE